MYIFSFLFSLFVKRIMHCYKDNFFFIPCQQCDCPWETGLLHNQICRAHPWEVVSGKGQKLYFYITFYWSIPELLWQAWKSRPKKYSCCCCLQFSNGWSFGDQMCETSKIHNLLKPYKALSEKVSLPKAAWLWRHASNFFFFCKTCVMYCKWVAWLQQTNINNH